MTSPSEQIVGLYERHARAWAADRQRGSFQERRWLERFAALLPRGASVLDVGCGAGAPIASYLLDAGFRVTGIDSSPTMIEMCHARHPHGEWLVDDMRTLALGRLASVHERARRRRNDRQLRRRAALSREPFRR